MSERSNGAGATAIASNRNKRGNAAIDKAVFYERYLAARDQAATNNSRLNGGHPWRAVMHYEDEATDAKRTPLRPYWTTSNETYTYEDLYKKWYQSYITPGMGFVRRLAKIKPPPSYGDDEDSDATDSDDEGRQLDVGPPQLNVTTFELYMRNPVVVAYLRFMEISQTDLKAAKTNWGNWIIGYTNYKKEDVLPYLMQWHLLPPGTTELITISDGDSKEHKRDLVILPGFDGKAYDWESKFKAEYDKEISEYSRVSAMDRSKLLMLEGPPPLERVVQAPLPSPPPFPDLQTLLPPPVAFSSTSPLISWIATGDISKEDLMSIGQRLPGVSFQRFPYNTKNKPGLLVVFVDARGRSPSTIINAANVVTGWPAVRSLVVLVEEEKQADRNQWSRAMPSGTTMVRYLGLPDTSEVVLTTKGTIDADMVISKMLEMVASPLPPSKESPPKPTEKKKQAPAKMATAKKNATKEEKKKTPPKTKEAWSPLGAHEVYTASKNGNKRRMTKEEEYGSKLTDVTGTYRDAKARAAYLNGVAPKEARNESGKLKEPFRVARRYNPTDVDKHRKKPTTYWTATQMNYIDEHIYNMWFTSYRNKDIGVVDVKVKNSLIVVSDDDEDETKELKAQVNTSWFPNLHVESYEHYIMNPEVDALYNYLIDSNNGEYKGAVDDYQLWLRQYLKKKDAAILLAKWSLLPPNATFEPGGAMVFNESKVKGNTIDWMTKFKAEYVKRTKDIIIPTDLQREKVDRAEVKRKNNPYRKEQLAILKKVDAMTIDELYNRQNEINAIFSAYEKRDEAIPQMEFDNLNLEEDLIKERIQETEEEDDGLRDDGQAQIFMQYFPAYTAMKKKQLEADGQNARVVIRYDDSENADAKRTPLSEYYAMTTITDPTKEYVYALWYKLYLSGGGYVPQDVDHPEEEDTKVKWPNQLRVQKYSLFISNEEVDKLIDFLDLSKKDYNKAAAKYRKWLRKYVAIHGSGAIEQLINWRLFPERSIFDQVDGGPPEEMVDGHWIRLSPQFVTVSKKKKKKQIIDWDSYYKPQYEAQIKTLHNAKLLIKKELLGSDTKEPLESDTKKDKDDDDKVPLSKQSVFHSTLEYLIAKHNAVDEDDKEALPLHKSTWSQFDKGLDDRVKNPPQRKMKGSGTDSKETKVDDEETESEESEDRDHSSDESSPDEADDDEDDDDGVDHDYTDKPKKKSASPEPKKKLKRPGERSSVAAPSEVTVATKKKRIIVDDDDNIGQPLAASVVDAFITGKPALIQYNKNITTPLIDDDEDQLVDEVNRKACCIIM